MKVLLKGHPTHNGKSEWDQGVPVSEGHPLFTLWDNVKWSSPSFKLPVTQPTLQHSRSTCGVLFPFSGSNFNTFYDWLNIFDPPLEICRYGMWGRLYAFFHTMSYNWLEHLQIWVSAGGSGTNPLQIPRGHELNSVFQKIFSVSIYQPYNSVYNPHYKQLFMEKKKRFK